jgi:hypothetical protein
LAPAAADFDTCPPALDGAADLLAAGDDVADGEPEPEAKAAAGRATAAAAMIPATAAPRIRTDMTLSFMFGRIQSSGATQDEPSSDLNTT